MEMVKAAALQDEDIIKLSPVTTEVRKLYDTNRVAFSNRMRMLAKQHGWINI